MRQKISTKITKTLLVFFIAESCHPMCPSNDLSEISNLMKYSRDEIAPKKKTNHNVTPFKVKDSEQYLIMNNESKQIKIF